MPLWRWLHSARSLRRSKQCEAAAMRQVRRFTNNKSPGHAPLSSVCADSENPPRAASVLRLSTGHVLSLVVSMSVVCRTMTTAASTDIGGSLRAIADLTREPGGGLIVPPDNFSYVHRALIFALAARHCVPAVYSLRFMARE